MGSAEEIVFDFDFDFLNQHHHQPTTKNTFQNHAPVLFEDHDLRAKIDELQLKNGRLRKSILFLKPKVRQLSHFVCSFKAASKECEELKDNIRQTKETCTRHLVEINHFTERVARLENERQAAEVREKENNETICELENKIKVLQMVHTQLTQLVKDKNKTESTPVQVERKNGKFAAKDNEKKEVETFRAKILNLQKENEKLRKDITRIPDLEKQIEILNKNNILVSKSEKVYDHNEIARIQKLEKEIETLHKENVKIQKMDREIEDLNKENAKIPKFLKEIEILRKENAKILKLKKAIEDLNKENAKIPKFLKEIEVLRKENAKILKLEKDIEDLNKENAQIPKFLKEIEILRKENAKITMFENDNEIIKQNAYIADLEHNIKTRCKKNTKIQRVNEDFSKEIVEIPKKRQDIESHLTHPTLMSEKGKLPPKKSNPTRSYKSSSDRNSECSDNSEAENYALEDSLLSPTLNDTIVAKNSPIADKYIAVSCECNNESNQSFTNSDTDRSLHSPENFLNDRPSNGDNIENKANPEDAPIPSSPIMLEEIEIPSVTIVKHNENQNACEPKSASLRKSNSKSWSPFSQTNGAREVSNGVETSDGISSKKGTQVVQEKECLELNNSLQCESHTDLELEQIFSKMKLNFNALSPIPRTPTWRHAENSRFSELKEKIDPCCMCAKSGEFMRIISELFLQYAHLRNSDTNNGIDKLIEGLGSIFTNKTSNLEKTDYVFLQSDNNVRSILNSSTSSPEKDSEILQYKKNESRLSQNMMSLSTLQDNQNELLCNDNSVSISNPSSPDKNTNVLKVKKIEKVQRLPISVDENPKQLLNNSISEKLVVDNEMSKVISSGRKAKTKKNSKLEKLRKKLKPKYKIRREKTPPENLQFKPKQIFPIKKMVTDTSASLNDKDVYEKAVKIMAEINSQQSAKLAKSPPKHTKFVMSPRRTDCLENDIESSGNNQEFQKCPTTTPDKIKFSELLNTCTVVLIKDPLLSPRKVEKCTTHDSNEVNNSMTHNGEEDKTDSTPIHELPPKKRRRRSSNEPLIQHTRVLRSDTVHKKISTEDNIDKSKPKGESDTQLLVPNNENILQCLQFDQPDKNVVSYGDLGIFSEDLQLEKKMSAPVKVTDSSACHPKESILCNMIEKYGVETVKPFGKKIPDKLAKQVCEKIEQDITKIRLMKDTKDAMNSLVADLRKFNYKNFIAGLIQYLVKPERKNELFGRISSSPAPAMTKAEQILLYVIAQLKPQWPEIVDGVLSSIEFTLFKLNRTPDFDVIESTSHFYAVLCRYFKAKSRLRLFILDAMYCIQFKSVPLIKQCLEVWMHILPLGHMGIAKSPMVTCLVYLLHFYKCDDRHNRVQDIRNLLSRKYFYQITDWNEPKILEMFKNSIHDLKDISIEKKMLRLALIILAKRQGPHWTQVHIIKNLLQPMIEKENVSNNVKEFCVSVIGPLMKPYPADMKVHCEIAINQLMDILNNNPSPKMEEAAITSMIYINRHDQRSVNKMLLSRKMKPMTLELEKSICDYVKAKPLKTWKKHLATIAR